MNALLNQDEWRQTTDVFPMFQYLLKHGRMNRALWRSFHCACCRDVWDYLSDPRSRTAVETAEGYLSGTATLDDLESAFQHVKLAEDEAWSVVQSLREAGNENNWVWPVTQNVDDAWIRYITASAAKTCTENGPDEVLFTTIPDSAACVRAWSNARREILKTGKQLAPEKLREAVLETWQQMRRVEETRQAAILRSIVDLGGK